MAKYGGCIGCTTVAQIIVLDEHLPSSQFMVAYQSNLSVVVV